MVCRALVVTLAIGAAALPAATQAYDIKAKTPESAFSGKLRPDILGISADSTADSARTVLESLFKGRTNATTDVQQQKFGDTAISFISALNFSLPAGPTQSGEVLSSSFSSPASGNRVYFLARNLTFAKDQQPAKADMVKEVMGKYGAPTIVGDQHLYYIYRKGSIVSVGTKYKEATARRRHRQAARSQGRAQAQRRNHPRQLRGGVKRAQAKEKTLAAMLSEAKGANCDGVLSVQLIPGTRPDRVGIAQFSLLDVKRVISAAAIDNDALAAEQSERNAMPKGSAPKL